MIFSRTSACLLTLAFVLSSSAYCGANGAPVTFAAQVDNLKNLEGSQREELEKFLAEAEQVVAEPLVARVYSLADMGKVVDGRRFVDTRSKAEAYRNKLSDELAEQFALASSDMATARESLDRLPFLAAVYRLNRSPAVLKHLIAQLEEIGTWTPFQRPGWSLPHRKGTPLPEGGDGVWLATGTLIQALAITLDILPDEALPVELRNKIRQALEREMKLIEDDWKTARPWFVKQSKAESNQWIVPSSGLVIAACVLGREKFPEAYALGVKNLTMSLRMCGPDGSMSEGHIYAFSWSSISLMLADRFMRMSGDNQFSDHPFFRKFPVWMASYFQPGGYVVNSFDGFGATRRYGVTAVDSELNSFAAISEDPGLCWLVKNVVGGPTRDLFGLLTLALLNKTLLPPPLSGLFERSHAFFWRSSWAFDASGLWLRGGDKMDFHDHADRGHLNLILHGKAVLIEAGTPGYSHPRKASDYDSVAGHNVLQVGETPTSTKAAAPIRVEHVDAAGGAIQVEAGTSYPELSSWNRSVRWTVDEANIVDEVKVSEGKQKLRFRWHLGSAESAEISGSGDQYEIKVPAGRLEFPGWIGSWARPGRPPQEPDVVETPEIILRIKSDRPIRVSQAEGLDHLFKFRIQGHEHTVIVVEVEGEADAWRLETRVASAQVEP
jgi:hypothetical protein